MHAGWRGLAAGIVHRAVSLFERPDRVLAAIGPAIGADHYEVGPEVPAALAETSSRGAVTGRRNGRTQVDLAATAERVLDEHGVRRIERADLCTACWPARFYSYRRDGGAGGRAWSSSVGDRDARSAAAERVRRRGRGRSRARGRGSEPDRGGLPAGRAGPGDGDAGRGHQDRCRRPASGWRGTPGSETSGRTTPSSSPRRRPRSPPRGTSSASSSAGRPRPWRGTPTSCTRPSPARR